jgi:hypothetical protein
MIATALLALTQLGIGYTQYRFASADNALYAVFVGPLERAELEHEVVGIVSQPRIAVARVLVFENTRAAMLGTRQGGTELTYGNYDSRRKRIPEKCLPVLDIMKVDRKVVSRRVDGSCHISQKLLTDGNAQLFESAQITFRIVSFDLRMSQSTAQKVPEPMISWLIQTDAPVSSVTAQSALEYLQKLVPVPNVLIELRNDPWFLTSAAFPLLYPFAIGAPPARLEYLATSQAVCSLLAGAPAYCWVEKPE